MRDRNWVNPVGKGGGRKWDEKRKKKPQARYIT